MAELSGFPRQVSPRPESKARVRLGWGSPKKPQRPPKPVLGCGSAPSPSPASMDAESRATGTPSSTSQGTGGATGCPRHPPSPGVTAAMLHGVGNHSHGPCVPLPSPPQLRGRDLITVTAAPLPFGDQNQALHPPPGMRSTAALRCRARFGDVAHRGEGSGGDVGAPRAWGAPGVPPPAPR